MGAARLAVNEDSLFSFLDLFGLFFGYDFWSLNVTDGRENRGGHLVTGSLFGCIQVVRVTINEADPFK